MFKKLLSALTVMLVMFSIDAGAQVLQKKTLSFSNNEVSDSKGLMTSTLPLKKNEKWIGYWDGQLDLEHCNSVGPGMASTYAVAIGYPAGAPELIGKTIEGIKFGIFDDTNVDYNIRLFISTELPSPTAGATDITMESFSDWVTVFDYNSEMTQWNEVRFARPYAVNPGKPVYIGYIFQEFKGPHTPFDGRQIIAKQEKGGPGSFLVNIGAKQWEDAAQQDLGIAAIQILVSGDDSKKANDVVINSKLSTIIGQKGSSVIPVTVNNSGENGISSLELEVDVNGVKTTYTAVPEKPIKGMGAEYSFNATVNTPNTARDFEYTVKVTKINGEAVTKDIIGKGKMIILTRKARHKVLFEEFTSMTCAYCPFGHVALERLNKMYGDNVVRVAIHVDDPLMSGTEYPTFAQNTTGGNFPTCHIDRRVIRAHPYAGLSEDVKGFGISKDVEACINVPAVAEITSVPVIEGDKLIANADVEFLFSGSAYNYAVAFILTEDGMQNDIWKQSNGLIEFKGDGLEKIDPLLDPWINGDRVMPCVYNSVAHDVIGVKRGFYGTVPMTVKAGEINRCHQEFDLTKYPNIQNRDNLCVAVALFNGEGDGVVVNSDIAPVNASASGIENVSGGRDVVETARYTIDGRRINTAEKGVNIVKYSDGTVKKVVVR